MSTTYARSWLQVKIEIATVAITTMKPEYLTFYLDGRNAATLRIDTDAIIDDVVARVKNGDAVWSSVHAAVAAAAQSFCVDGTKRRKFVRDCEDEIKDAGGDETAAWEAFCAGKIDELCGRVEPAIVETLEDDVEGVDEEEDDEDEDEDAEPDEDEPAA